MSSLNRIRFWALLLLSTVVCWPLKAGLAQQRSNPASSSNQKAQAARNPNRQAALSQLKAAAAERAKTDPAFKAYLDALANHDKQVKAFVRARKGGAR